MSIQDTQKETLNHQQLRDGSIYKSMDRKRSSDELSGQHNHGQSVLQVPSHVTLNHLYALSIRDDVMGLATTVRYRNKYVTTILYRPVESV